MSLKLSFRPLKIASLLMATLSLVSCGYSTPEKSATDRLSVASGIVGGDEVSPEQEIASMVVMVVDTQSSQICSGTLIADNLVLTAAHCIGPSPEAMHIYFGVDPFNTVETPVRPVVQVLIHELYNPENQAKNDVALVRFKDGLPPGFKTASIAENPLGAGDGFTAAGLGRSDGRLSKRNLENDGSGRLRSVQKTVASLGTDPSYFVVSQTSGQGVCPGDSGGPALKKTEAGWLVVGVASALSIEEFIIATDGQSEDFNFCAHEALYMDSRYFRPWILENSTKMILDEKLSQQPGDSNRSVEQNPVPRPRQDTSATVTI